MRENLRVKILNKWVAVGLFVVMSACGSAEKKADASGQFSQTALLGQYDIGLASCAKGQLDPVDGSEFLKMNRLMAYLSKGTSKSTVLISQTEFITSVPSTLYGASNDSCIVTTNEALNYTSNHSLTLKLKSRTCSGSCATTDCKPEKQISSASLQSFDYSFDGKKLLLTVNDAKTSCVLNGAKSAPQVEYTKQ